MGEDVFGNTVSNVKHRCGETPKSGNLKAWSLRGGWYAKQKVGKAGRR